jgi:cell wall-associated NlpC family hydrolase
LLLAPEAQAARASKRRAPAAAQVSQGAKRRTPAATLARKAAWRVSRWVGLSSLARVSRAVNDDCSGLAQLAYRPSGLSLMPERTLPGENGVTAIRRKAVDLGALRRKPRPGYLVFFEETHDRNKDGARNDGLTHIGVVERVHRDGTVTFVHRAGSGVKRSKLNLRFPHLRRDARGRVLNDYVRRPDGISELRLAGELFAGFATVDTRWKAPKAPPRSKRTSARR